MIAPIETELKFLIVPEALSRLRAHPALQAPEHVRVLKSVYFDTPGHDLRQAGLALRLRDDGEGFVQTLKDQNDAGSISRGEWETPVKAWRIDPDALAETPAWGVLEGRIDTLEPVFSTTVERRVRRCDGIEVSFDSGEVSTGERGEPIEEMELELKTGEPGRLFDFARRLVQDVPVRLSFENKAERGYRLAAGEALEPRAGARPRLGLDLRAAEAFQRIARACLAQAAGNAELLAGPMQRPEVLHQTRIGLRRLRAAISAFKAMLADDRLAEIERELKWLSGELDWARDLDVFIRNTFVPAAEAMADESLAPLGRRLLEAQTKAYSRAVDAVRSQRCSILLLETTAWIETGPWTADADPVLAGLRDKPTKAFAVEALDHLRKVVRRRGRGLDRLDPGGRHKLRIRGKRLRYVAEFFAPLFEGPDKRRRRFLAALRRMQDELGELNDIAVARERALKEAGLGAGPLAFAAGRAVGRREGGEKARLRAAIKGFDAFDGAEPFWK